MTDMNVQKANEKSYQKLISIQSAKSVSENREKLNGLLLSSKNAKFEFRSLLGLKSVLDELENRLYSLFKKHFQFSECEWICTLKNDLEILSVLTYTAKWNVMVNYSSNSTTYVIC